MILMVGITVGGTYAYLVSRVNSGNNIITNSSRLSVIYTGGTEINGNLELVNSKEEGYNTTIDIKLSEDSVDAKADIFIYINKITSSIANSALNWEVHKIYEGVETFVNSGTFLDCINGNTTKTCANGDKIYIVRDYQLTTTDTYYKVYIWLDGNKVGNEVLGATLSAYIGAETEHITTNLNNS